MSKIPTTMEEAAQVFETRKKAIEMGDSFSTNWYIPTNRKANQLHPITVTGELAYARLASFIDGEELDRRNAEAQERRPGTDPMGPFVTVSLINPVVLSGNDNDPVNWLNARLTELRFYTPKASSNNPNPALTFRQNAKAGKLAILPNFFKLDESGTAIVGFDPEGKDLARGQKVSISFNLYATQGGYAGYNLTDVMVHSSEPKFYQPTGPTTVAPTAMAAALGMTIASGPVQATTTHAPVADQWPLESPAEQAPDFVQPAAAPAPVAQNPVTPVAPAPAAPVAVAPVAAAAPAAQPAAQEPVSAVQPTPAPAPAAAPAATMPDLAALQQLPAEQLAQILAAANAAAQANTAPAAAPTPAGAPQLSQFNQ